MNQFPQARVDGLFAATSRTKTTTQYCWPLEFTFDGIVIDQRHTGRTRPADMRVKGFYRGKNSSPEVLNRQHVSIIDDVSLDYIGDNLDINPEVVAKKLKTSRTRFLASCLGANILINDFEGTQKIKTFYDVPIGTDFGQCDAFEKFIGATTMLTRYNEPCIHPGKNIERLYPGATKGTAQKFMQVAEGCRGFVGMVVMPGFMSYGNTLTFQPAMVPPSK